MNDRSKTKPTQIRELYSLRRRVAALERLQRDARHMTTAEKDEAGSIQAEDALKESEARFRNLMEFIPNVSIQGYRTDGTVAYWNRASEKVYGYTAEEAIGRNLADLIIPSALRPVFEECLSRGATCGESGELFPPGELTLRRKDGSPVSVYSIHTVVCVEEAAPLLFCIDMDLSDQKRQERALRESEERFRFLVEKVADVAFVADMNLTTIYISPSIENVLGFTPEERKAQSIDQQLTPETQKMVIETLAVELARERQPGTDPDRALTLTLQCYHKDGSIRHLETHIRGVRDDAGQLTGFCGLQHDVTERRKDEEELRESEKKYRDLAELLPQVVFESDLNGNLTFVNRMGYTMFGYSIENRKTDMRIFDLIAPQDRARAAERAASIMSGGKGARAEFMAVRKDGGQFPVVIYAGPILRESRVMGMRGTLIDITERKQTEKALRESEERYRMIFEHSNDVIYSVDRDFHITSVSPSVERLLGYRPEEFIGRPLGEIAILSAEDQNRAFFEMTQVFAGMRFSASEYTFIAKNGRRLIGEVSGAPLVRDGVIVGLISVARDITERKQAEEAIRQLAFHDALTGLPNRKLFSDRLEIALAQARRNRGEIGVAMLDLDNFKDVNDTLGHDRGDMALKEAAERLSHTLRKGDTVARLGGDEFILVLPELKEPGNALQVAEKIVDAFRAPFLIDGHELRITTSIGVAVYPRDGMDAETLVKNADSAMYQAKQSGRDRYRFYQSA